MIGVDAPAHDGNSEPFFEKGAKSAEGPEKFAEKLRKCGVAVMFAGHEHLAYTSVV